VTGVKC